jgi:hypothetical protein
MALRKVLMLAFAATTLARAITNPGHVALHIIDINNEIAAPPLQPSATDSSVLSYLSTTGSPVVTAPPSFETELPGWAWRFGHGPVRISQLPPPPESTISADLSTTTAMLEQGNSGQWRRPSWNRGPHRRTTIALMYFTPTAHLDNAKTATPTPASLAGDKAKDKSAAERIINSRGQPHKSGREYMLDLPPHQVVDSSNTSNSDLSVTLFPGGEEALLPSIGQNPDAAAH